MKKALLIIGLSSSLATVLINLIPENEIGLKILLFIILGLLVFGISWALENINKILEGLIFGVIIGAFLGIISAVIDNSAASLSDGIEKTFILSFKWILPILAYTYFGVDPWKNQ